MTRCLALAVALLTADPTHAHCFSIWRYKTPQHCRVWPGHVVSAPSAIDRNWYIEIVPPPSWHDDFERQQALDRLKAQLQSGQQ